MPIYLIFVLINVNQLLYFDQVWCWEKRDSLQKFWSWCNKMLVSILIFLVFSKLVIQYLQQGEISVHNVREPVKVVLVKNDYLLHRKFELHRYQHCAVFTEKTFYAYSHKLIVRLIPTWIRYNLLTVSQIWPSNHQLSYSAAFNFVN